LRWARMLQSTTKNWCIGSNKWCKSQGSYSCQRALPYMLILRG
jgi:hypothetical protein